MTNSTEGNLEEGEMFPAALSLEAKRVLRRLRTSGYSSWSTRGRKHLDAARHSRQESDGRTEMEVEGRATHGVQLQLGLPLLLRRTSHLRQVRDGPRLPHREGQLRRGGARRIEIHPRRGVAEGDPPGTRPWGPRKPSRLRGRRHRHPRHTEGLELEKLEIEGTGGSTTVATWSRPRRRTRATSRSSTWSASKAKNASNERIQELVKLFETASPAGDTHPRSVPMTLKAIIE